MKVRQDFVTNSSSSSFIISTSQEVPQNYVNVCKLITKESLHEFYHDRYHWRDIGYGSDEKLQEVANLTDEQMLLIKMAIDGELESYLDLKEKLEQTNEAIYSIYVDRDWLYYQEELKKFIEGSNIVEADYDA